MTRHLPVIALVLLGTSLRADIPSVADLVRQLGDRKFAVREAAQKELLKRGEGVVPELDRLSKGVDAETADRLAKVRYNLAGYKDDIRRCIVDIKSKRGLFDPIPSELNLPSQLRYLIADHQPGAGDLLLDLAADEKGQLWYETRHLFVQAWDVMTADQLDRYIRQTVRLGTTHRPKFPAKVPAMISFEAGLRDGQIGWPNPVPKGFTFRARTTRYLDGKRYDKPYERNDPVATVGWYRVGELAEGKHTIHAVMEYEFTQNGQKRKGEVRSKDSTFEVVSADTPDDLVAPKSVAMSNFVRAAFRMEGIVADGFGKSVVEARGIRGEALYPPQVTWNVSPGVLAGVRCPEWQVTAPPSVDLCMEAEIHDRAGKVYPADPVVVTGDATARGYIIPRDIRAFAKDRDGLVTVTVVLKPSRALALSDVRVKQYFPEPITLDGLRMKVVPKIEPPSAHK